MVGVPSKGFVGPALSPFPLVSWPDERFCPRLWLQAAISQNQWANFSQTETSKAKP